MSCGTTEMAPRRLSWVTREIFLAVDGDVPLVSHRKIFAAA